MSSKDNNVTVLVTGGSGFVALHAISQLLNQGYRVRATLRSLSKQTEVTNALRRSGITALEHLQFVETDLSNDKNWDQAMQGCSYVLHIASPIHLQIPKDENEMIRPAVDGTLRVLRAAKKAGVKRVVMTSNFGAVGYSHHDRTKSSPKRAGPTRMKKDFPLTTNPKCLPSRLPGHLSKKKVTLWNWP